MRTLRVLAAALVSLLIAIGIGLWYAAQHQSELGKLILAQIGERTGLQIEASGTRLGFGTHLVVVLEHLQVAIGHEEIARLQSVRAVFSYGALLHHTGLPLHSLVLEHGTIAIPRSAGRTANGGAAIKAAVNSLAAQYLDTLSEFSRHLVLVDITLQDRERRALADHINVVARREHYRVGKWPWIVDFNAEAKLDSIAGARFSGKLRLGSSRDHPNALALGRLWFWELRIPNLSVGDFTASGRLRGYVTLALSPDAEIGGNFSLKAGDVVLGGSALTSPLQPADYQSHGSYRLAPDRADLTGVELVYGRTSILNGAAAVTDPFENGRAVTFSVSGVTLELAESARWLQRLRVVPSSLVEMAGRFRSGTLMLTDLALKTPEPLGTLNLKVLRKRLKANAIFTHIGYIPPPDLNLPPVYEFDAQLAYADGIAQIRQGTGQIGDSSVSDLNVELNLRNVPARLKYQIKAAGWFDTGELYRATANLVQQAEPRLQRELLWVHGHAPLEVRASDTIEGFQASIPRNYFLRAELGDVQFELKQLPGAISLSTGSVEVEPARITMNKVVLLPLDQTGNAVLDGVVLTDNAPAKFRDFVVELHQLEADKWLPLMVDPQELGVTGPIGGRLIANSPAAPGAIPTITGKLTLSGGTIHFGFLRNPIMVTHSATLALDGKGLLLNIPASRIEGEPLDFRMSIADLAHPEIRIDARAARLDFEVMRFIRLPWSHGTPPTFFPLPVSGHIEAGSGNFDKLAMTDISTDFTHNSQAWRVYNFRAKAFNGTIDLSIAGYGGPNNWINIKGVIAAMDAAPLFLLSGKMHQAPIVGKLAARGDLWANTDTDFFNTLAGTLSVTMTDGALNRFTLLRRILSLINLKNWLTAQMPDPREAGVPFKVLSADFRGVRGVFHTDNLRLDGPVMDIVARGDFDVGNSTMNMEIDLLAFQTVNWLMSNIPIVGKRLAGGTRRLVGAFFQVKGPVDDPTIWPKPITSVAEFVFRTLTLPISIIAPESFN